MDQQTTRTPKAYREVYDGYTKPAPVRHILLTQHMEKEQARAWLDEIVAKYEPSPDGQVRFMSRIADWMKHWYDIRSHTALDCQREYQTLADAETSSLYALLDADDTLDEHPTDGYATIKARRDGYMEHVKINDENWRYEDQRRGQVQEAMSMFVGDFQSTNY